MFTSLRSKIIFFLSLIMALTASVIMYFTDVGVGEAIRQKEKASAQNVLRLVDLNIEEEYEKLLSNKIETVQNRRSLLKDITGIAVAALTRFDQLVENGNITQMQFGKMVENWFREVAFQKGLNWFVFNTNGQVVAHPDERLHGSSIASLTDMKGRLIAEVMRWDVLNRGGDYAVIQWQGQEAGKKLAYFEPYANLQWTVGATIDISDIEAEFQNKLNRMIQKLGETFAKIQIAETGCVILFDGHKEVLVGPQRQTAEGLLDEHLMDRIIKAVAEQKESFQYTAKQNGLNQPMQAYASYFKSLDWYIAVTVPTREIQAPARKLIKQQILLIALIFVGSLAASFLLVTQISRPLNMLARHAKKLAHQDFTVDGEKADPIDALPEKYKDEVGRLAESFIFMKAELKKNIRELMETTASRERILSELNVARTIQLGILPKTFPAFPDCAAFDLYALLEPAKSVGGDLYDYFFIDDDHLCFTIGDVSDKGVPAALFMVITRTLIKTMVTKDKSPADVMGRINNLLSVDNPNSMFVTLIIGIMDIHTGEIKYANGGHNPPLILSKEKGVYYKKDLSGPVVGAIEDLPYKELTLSLGPGESLFLYTDGITEAMDENNNLFSDNRLFKEVSLLANEPVDKVVQRIRKMVGQHAGTAAQSDDITMLMIRYQQC